MHFIRSNLMKELQNLKKLLPSQKNQKIKTMLNTCDKLRQAVYIRARKWRDEDEYAICDYGHIPAYKQKFDKVEDLKNHLKQQFLRIYGEDVKPWGKGGKALFRTKKQKSKLVSKCIRKVKADSKKTEDDQDRTDDELQMNIN